MGTLYRHGTNPPDFGQDFVPPRVTFLKEPSVRVLCMAVQGYRSPVLYPLYCAGLVNTRNARGNPATLPLLGSPESGQVSESGTSDKSATLHPLSTAADRRPEKGSSDPISTVARRAAHLVIDHKIPLRHAASRGVTHDLGSVQALPWSCLVPIHSVLTDDSVKAQGSCARIVHGSFTTGGLGTLQTGKLSPAGRSPNFPHPQLAGRPCTTKKGDGGAQKTQQKPAGFLGGSSC